MNAFDRAEALRQLGRISNHLPEEPGKRSQCDVERSRDLDRILAIPLRTEYDDDQRDAIRSMLTKPGSDMRLWDIQCDGLLAALSIADAKPSPADGRVPGFFGLVAVGGGKCLGPDVPVLMFDGSVKPACGVVSGDRLMGPDSRPRLVLSTCVGRGPMYRIKPTKGDPWDCNDAHMLTLVDSSGRPPHDGKIVDVSVQDFLQWPKYKQNNQKLFRVPVNFPKQAQPLIDPYFFGVWIGDGSHYRVKGELKCVAVSKPDTEIKQACFDEATKWGLEIRTIIANSGCPTHFLHGERGVSNTLLTELRRCVDDGLSLIYLQGNRDVRLQFLAGVCDTDGYLHHGFFEIMQKRRDWADAIMFVARSLGFGVTIRAKIVNGETYWRMNISGDVGNIPTRIPRKQAQPRKQKKDPLRTGFKIEPLDTSSYYGWELDGDGRFLLGDFTVTHNTLLSALLGTIWQSERPLILTDAALVDQTIALINSYRRCFYISDKLHVYGYSILSIAEKEHIINDFDPTSIVCDEAANLRNPKSARGRRIRRRLKLAPSTKLANLTGTPARNSIKDWAELAGLALGAWSPGPLAWDARQEWSEALDPEPSRGVGALRLFLPHPHALTHNRTTDAQNVNEALADRIARSPGCVVSPEEVVDIPLIIKVIKGPHCDRISEAYKDLTKTWARPDGEELVTAAEFAEVKRQITLGGYYAWAYEPDREWLLKRRLWKRAARAWINAHPGKLHGVCIDSQRGLELAILRDDVTDDEVVDPFVEWLAIKDEAEEPPKVWEWISSEVCDWISGLLNGEPIACFVKRNGFARGVAETSGASFFGSGDHPGYVDGKTSIILSLDTFKKGLNLQAFSRAIVVDPPPGAADWQQFLGRLHRPGQKAREVTYLIPDYFTEDLGRAIEGARWLQSSTGMNQKLLASTIKTSLRK